MDTSRWNDGDRFPVLDLVAEFRFKTASSVSFDLGTPDATTVPEIELPALLCGANVFFVLGWLDVHHPCEGFHPLHLRVGLPERYARWEAMRDLVPLVKAALGLPADEPFHVYLTGLGRQTSMENPQSGFVSRAGGRTEA